jgi:hypothetical protein
MAGAAGHELFVTTAVRPREQWQFWAEVHICRTASREQSGSFEVF